jgi:predicted esterase
MQRVHASGQNRVIINTPLPFDSLIRKPNSGVARELVLLLHGFAESGERLFQKLDAALTDDIREHALVMAPNALFPMPHKSESGYRVTFSWYFYEPGAAEYYIDMKPAVEFLKEGIRAQGAWTLPKRIIGFSQGGFLAPILASELLEVRQLIGLGCEYLVDEIPGRLPDSVPYRVDAVHGSADDQVNPVQARQSHQRLMDAGIKGSFCLLEGTTHRVDDRMRQAVNALLSTHARAV